MEKLRCCGEIDENVNIWTIPSFLSKKSVFSGFPAVDRAVPDTPQGTCTAIASLVIEIPRFYSRFLERTAVFIGGCGHGAKKRE
jgi:hypothetical protein